MKKVALSMLIMIVISLGITNLTLAHGGAGCCGGGGTPNAGMAAIDPMQQSINYATNPGHTHQASNDTSVSPHRHMAWLGTPLGFVVTLLIIAPLARLWSDYIAEWVKDIRKRRADKHKARSIVLEEVKKNTAARTLTKK